MSTMQTRLGDARNWIENHRAQALAVLVLLAAIVLIIGLSLSWFVGSKSLSTVGKIQTPAQLKIMGPNQTSIEPIEISYDESRGGEKKDDGTVTVRRAFCVQSDNGDPAAGGQAFELQIANTTNITGLTINVYHVTVNNPNDKNGTVVGLDGSTAPTHGARRAAPRLSLLLSTPRTGQVRWLKSLRQTTRRTARTRKSRKTPVRCIGTTSSQGVGSMAGMAKQPTPPRTSSSNVRGIQAL